MMKILLICGFGASTGLIASNMRKYAKKAGIDAEIAAQSKADLVDSLNEGITILLVGAHYLHELDNIKEIVKPYNVPVMIIDKKDYAMMDGEAVMKKVLAVLKEKEK